MITELMEMFKKQYDIKGDALIIDRYELKPGIYIKINIDKTIDSSLIINKKNDDINHQQYNWFASRDYLSNLIDMNKPIDGKKKIHSNNYMSFFMKKEVLVGEKSLSEDALLDRIEEYYNILSNPELKYNSKKKSLELYNEIDVPINEELLRFCKDYLVNYIKDIKEQLEKEQFTNYVKLFFDVPYEEYEKESNRYLIPNLYNNNNYNIKINGNVYGLTNNNMGLNAKKPYLEHKTKYNSMPYLVDSKEILVHKKFFDWISTRKSGFLYIDADSDFVEGIEENIKVGQGNCYFLYIKQGKEPELRDYEYLTGYNNDLYMEVPNYIDAQYKKDNQWLDMERETFQYLYEIEKFVDYIFFNQALIRHYKSDSKDIKTDQDIKNILLLTRDAFYEYFKKGKTQHFKSVFKKHGIELVKRQLTLGNIYQASKGLNFYFAINNEKGGIEKMGGIYKQTIENIKEKLLLDDYLDCESDEEYYVLAGQVVRYLTSQSQSRQKDHSTVDPFLNCKKDKRLKNEINTTFAKYSHAIVSNYVRFNQGLSMIEAYQPQNENVDTQLFLAGFLGKNIFFEGKESVDNEK
ncbi:hypothetical protein [Natranaerovirga hydrolytica]|uniref:hypothetical protein n=1 Tax=Natranaerovirga hydrolytica TaxID=680378 RepID=UPI00104A6840|nr:hypothetical protein [Natranaerovirga hydrolytica]